MSSRLKVCFTGCSFTYGEGFDSEERDIYPYSQVLAARHNWEVTNIAQRGASNYNIFLSAARSIQSEKYDIVSVQWSALNRIWLSPGPETYYFTNDSKNKDYSYRDLYINKSDKEKLKNLLLILNHDYQNILDLVDYCNILEDLSKIKKTKIIFINGLLPWQNDLRNTLDEDLEKSLSKYSKEILDFETRSDEEIIDYFSKLQKKVLTLDCKYWVNMFDSFSSNIIDVAHDGGHPGILSHRLMADKISNYINNREIK